MSAAKLPARPRTWNCGRMYAVVVGSRADHGRPGGGIGTGVLVARGRRCPGRDTSRMVRCAADRCVGPAARAPRRAAVPVNVAAPPRTGKRRANSSTARRTRRYRKHRATVGQPCSKRSTSSRQIGELDGLFSRCSDIPRGVQGGDGPYRSSDSLRPSGARSPWRTARTRPTYGTLCRSFISTHCLVRTPYGWPIATGRSA